MTAITLRPAGIPQVTPSTFTRFASMPPTARRDESGALLVEAVISASSDVQRRDARGAYIERVPVLPEVWVPLPETVQLRDNHRADTARAILGEVRNARFEGGQMVATLRVTDSTVAEAVERGATRHVSIAGAVVEREWIREGNQRVLLVKRARLTEVSIVLEGGDPLAVTRSITPADPAPSRSLHMESNPAAADTPDLAAMIERAVADAMAVERAAQPAAAAQPARPIIRAAVGFSNDEPAVIQRRMVEALAADAAGVPVEDAGATLFRGMGFRGLIRAAVEGEPGARYMSDSAAVEAAFTRSGASHSTSDFPLITLGAGQRIVGHAYQEAASPLEAHLVTYGVAPDFRPVTEVQRGGVGDLKPLSENGEIQSVTTAEAGTTWQLGTYAARLDVSRKMILNDDLGLFGSLSADMGRAARRTETSAIIALLTSAAGVGPNMADGNPLFHTASHGNLAAGGSIPGFTSVSDAIEAMQAQRGIGGEILGIRPAYLVVSPANEWNARTLLATITPTKADDVNPLSGIMELIVEPRLSGGAWYVFAKPSAAPVLKVGHLAGQRGPVVQQQDRWNGLGTSFRVFTDFGVTAVDHRGAYRNVGA